MWIEGYTLIVLCWSTWSWVGVGTQDQFLYPRLQLGDWHGARRWGGETNYLCTYMSSPRVWGCLWQFSLLSRLFSCLPTLTQSHTPIHSHLHSLNTHLPPSQTIFRHMGKFGLVNSLFLSRSLRRNVGSPIRLLCEIDVLPRNNGDQESWVIEAVCRRLG